MLKQFQIDITNRCNMNCIHCRNGKLNDDEITELTYEDCIRVFHEAHELGCESVNISGGEPLLHKDVYRLIKYISKYCYTNLLTNAYTINSDAVKKLKDAKINMVQISFDSSIPEKYNKIRNNMAFENVKKAIKLLTEANIQVCFMVTLSSYNVNEVEDILYFAQEHNVVLVNFRRLIPQGNGNKNFEILNLSQNEISTFLKKAKDLETKFNLGICLFPFYVLRQKSLTQNYLASPFEVAESGCSAGVSGLSVASNGNIQLCPHIPLSLGNIYTDRLYKIWFENQLILQLRNRKNLKGKCGVCEFQNICGGCRAYPYQLQNDLFAEDELCDKGQIALDK